MTTNEMTTTVIGNLGKDAVLKTLPSGHKVAVTSIAVNTGNKTEWMTVQVWGDKRATGVAPTLRVGALMKFTGTPKAEAWLDKATGLVRSALVLNVNFNDKIAWLSSQKPADTADLNVQEPQESEIPF